MLYFANILHLKYLKCNNSLRFVPPHGRTRLRAGQNKALRNAGTGRIGKDSGEVIMSEWLKTILGGAGADDIDEKVLSPPGRRRATGRAIIVKGVYFS